MEKVRANYSHSSVPKVSIVLPTYNQHQWLQTAVHSILRQTFRDFELIIVNDGSTDETPTILNTLNDPRIHVIHQENSGLPEALNTGFAQARGEYLTWTSTDNTAAPTWLESLVSALDRAPADTGYAFSYYAGVNENGAFLFINRDIRFDIPSLLFHHTGNASFLYRASLAEKVGPYDKSLAYAEDLDMWVRMAEHTHAILVPTVLYNYRVHHNTMSAEQPKVCEATRKTVEKFLQKHNGQFPVEDLFPTIRNSSHPDIERWLSRLRLVTMGYRAHFYTPVDALLDQLAIALGEKFNESLVANMVHLLADDNRWDKACECVARYRAQHDSPFLQALSDITSRKDRDTLKNIPFMGVEENKLASDLTDPAARSYILRNLVQPDADVSLESITKGLITELSDDGNHPETWQRLAAMRSQGERMLLTLLSDYLFALLQVPQDPKALPLLQVLEAMCLAYSGQIYRAKHSLNKLHNQHFHPVCASALAFLEKDQERLMTEAIC